MDVTGSGENYILETVIICSRFQMIKLNADIYGVYGNQEVHTVLETLLKSETEM